MLRRTQRLQLKWKWTDNLRLHSTLGKPDYSKFRKLFMHVKLNSGSETFKLGQQLRRRSLTKKKPFSCTTKKTTKTLFGERKIFCVTLFSYFFLCHVVNEWMNEQSLLIHDHPEKYVNYCSVSPKALLSLGMQTFFHCCLARALACAIIFPHRLEVIVEPPC